MHSEHCIKHTKCDESVRLPRSTKQKSFHFSFPHFFFLLLLLLILHEKFSFYFQQKPNIAWRTMRNENENREKRNTSRKELLLIQRWLSMPTHGLCVVYSMHILICFEIFSSVYVYRSSSSRTALYCSHWIASLNLHEPENLFRKSSVAIVSSDADISNWRAFGCYFAKSCPLNITKLVSFFSCCPLPK